MKTNCLVAVFWVIGFYATAQTAAFSTPDTVCIKDPVTITNSSVGASSYYWNFCVADINATPAGTNLGNINGLLNVPVFMDYAFYNGNYYGFLINYYPGNLIRLDFGNSLLNTPTATSLGNFGGIIPPGNGAEGVQVVFNEGKWYAIIVGGWPVGGSTPRILKIDFGPNLGNLSPVATDWGNLGNMLQPIDLHVFKEGNNWYGFTVNAENNTITRFDFTSSFNNTPTAINLGNIGNLAYPTGIYAINDNGYWRVFITNAGDNTRLNGPFSLTRLDFGSSLLNTPTGVNLGNPGNLLQHPRDLTIMKHCEQIVGFAVNGHFNNSDMVKFDFHNDLSTVPTVTSLGNIGNASFPHSISKLFRVDDDVYGFMTNAANNTLTRLKFTGCTNSSVPNSNLPNPFPVTYDVPGTYRINLTIDDGLPSQSTFCREVVVVDSLKKAPLKFETLCRGNTLKIGSARTDVSYKWNTGATTDSILITSPGIYWVESSRFNCSVRDSFIVSSICDSISISGPNRICSTDTVTYAIYRPRYCTQAYALIADYSYVEVVSQSDSTVKVLFKRNGNTTLKVNYSQACEMAVDSISVDIKYSPQLIGLLNDLTICKDTALTLNANAGFDSYVWDGGSIGPTFYVNTPGQYVVTATNFCNLSVKDTFELIRTLPDPFSAFALSVSVCKGDSMQFSAAGGQLYAWEPASLFNDPGAASPKAVVKQNQDFSVHITNQACDRDTIIAIPIVPQATPAVTIFKTNDVDCDNDSAQLVASGAVTYSWFPDMHVSRVSNNKITVKPPQTTTYHVLGKNAFGCVGVDSVVVIFTKIGDQKLFVPNAFTPNNDGHNDVFKPTLTGPYAKFDFRIFNRWGQLVFQTNTYGVGWDGSFRSQPQPNGVFVFYITAEGGCNGTFARKGTFVLVK